MKEKKEKGILSDRFSELEQRAFINNRCRMMYRKKKLSLKCTILDHI
jgi:hypothetical protein